jgi:hypothetical protein
MKKTLLLFALFCVPFFLFSQAVLTYMAPSFLGTSGARAPNGTSAHTYFRGSTIVLGSELTTGIPNNTSLIKFGFMFNLGASSAVTGNLKVYMLNTTSTTYANGTDWTTLSAAMTLVYNGTYTVPVSTTPIPVDVTLNTPFTYTGAGIYVAYEWSSTGPFASTGAVYQCNNVLAGGVVMATSTTAPPTSLATTSAFRPCLRFGYNNPFTNDGVVLQVYTLGKLPIPFGNPHAIQAYIKNQGSDTLFSLPATLNVTGAQTFTNVKTIDTLLPGLSKLVTFDNFNPIITGANTVTVSVPSDQNNINNTLTKSLETNLNTYSYAQGTTPTGGVGFNGATGDFVAKFTTTTSQAMNQVDVRFSAGGQPFQIGIWSATVTGTPDALLYTSPTYTSTAGAYTVLIDPPVTIPAGSFFVGVRQTGTTNVNFSYQTEDPIRPNCFFYTSPSGGTTWVDFAPANAFRFMIEPKFALANDVSLTAVAPVATNLYVAGQPINLQATVINYGLNSQAAVPVVYSVNGGTPVGPVTTTVSLAQNDTNTVFFTGTNLFTPTSSGIYTVKVFTQLTGDQNVSNDTLTLVYNVLPEPITTYPSVQNFNSIEGWTTAGTPNLWVYASAHSPIEAIAVDSAMFADFFSAAAGASGMLRSPIFNLTGLTNPKLDFYVAYRTYTNEDDSLQIWVSTDLGQTFVAGSPNLYKKSYSSTPSLSTMDPNIADYVPANSSDWRLESVDLSQFIGATSLMIGFKGISANGNNCWIDQVKVYDNTAPIVTTTAATTITHNSIETGGNVVTEGGATVTARGVCYGISENPTITDTHTTDGAGTGTFTSILTGLTQNTTFYVRAYAANSIGTGYGEQIMVTTLVDGIDDVTNQGVKIYQMDKTLVVETVIPFESGYVTLYDANGKLVKNLSLVAGQTKISMNIDELVQGLYLININSGSQKTGYKVILK